MHAESTEKDASGFNTSIKISVEQRSRFNYLGKRPIYSIKETDAIESVCV